MKKITNKRSSDSLLEEILDEIPHVNIMETISDDVEQYDLANHNEFYRHNDWIFNDVTEYIKRFKNELFKKYKWKIIEEFAEENFWMSIAETEGYSY